MTVPLISLLKTGVGSSGFVDCARTVKTLARAKVKIVANRIERINFKVADLQFLTGFFDAQSHLGECDSTSRGGEERKTEETPVTEKPQETPPGARLIVEQTDGTRIDRPMSTVRRVIVEANVIVIILKTDRTERIPMASVARMAIEPQ